MRYPDARTPSSKAGPADAKPVPQVGKRPSPPALLFAIGAIWVAAGIVLVAFAHRQDKHVIKHYLAPSIGGLMNLLMLVGVVYLAVKAGGAAATDAYKALAIDGVWILLGVIWVLVNPAARDKKLLDHTAPKRTDDRPLVGS